MSQTTCPECHSENVYQDGNLWICPMCSHEWSALEKVSVADASAGSGTGVSAGDGAGGAATDGLIRDANGNVLSDGDSVTVIKELKIKGSSSAVKVGTKVKNIRLVPDGDDGHDIACKIDGIGAINLKSIYVRKA